MSLRDPAELISRARAIRHEPGRVTLSPLANDFHYGSARYLSSDIHILPNREATTISQIEGVAP